MQKATLPNALQLVLQTMPPLPIKLRQELEVKLLLVEKDLPRRAANAARAARNPALLAPGALHHQPWSRSTSHSARCLVRAC